MSCGDEVIGEYREYSIAMSESSIAIFDEIDRGSVHGVTCLALRRGTS
jgi:hypothetical protein